MEPLSEEIGPVNKPAAADLQTRLVRILSPETNGHDFRTRENTRAEGRGCLPLQGVRAAVRPVVSPEDKGFRGAAARRIALTPRRARHTYRGLPVCCALDTARYQMSDTFQEVDRSANVR